MTIDHKVQVWYAVYARLYTVAAVCTSMRTYLSGSLKFLKRLCVLLYSSQYSRRALRRRSKSLRGICRNMPSVNMSHVEQRSGQDLSRVYCQYHICKQTASCRQQTAVLYLSATDKSALSPDIAASMLPPHLTVPSNFSLHKGTHAKFDHITHVEDTHSKLTRQLRS